LRVHYQKNHKPEIKTAINQITPVTKIEIGDKP
jgi:hypothetical protein